MRHKTSSSEAAWWEEELSAAALPDKRLARRLQRLLDQMSAAPGKPIPAACGDWAAAKAAYRFFDNPRVTEHSVLAGHFAATAARIAASEGPILILQDTTNLSTAARSRAKSASPKPSTPGATRPGSPTC
ncbi:IS4/Tn5 family transposase DNA-binding protein [Mesorhizobium temperatum]|uniref:IS4/Tn5 family transposase DNA-binding protein n=1 Tax=Mesorhizobium temperatum TaxID=241416 RepID=UPI001FD9BBF8|nr:transposase DNA-binding-containing protein [Mesorhizobium temperatum]